MLDLVTQFDRLNREGYGYNYIGDRTPEKTRNRAVFVPVRRAQPDDCDDDAEIEETQTTV